MSSRSGKAKRLVQRSRRVHLAIGALLCLLVAPAGVANGKKPKQQKAYTADDLMIVDCLLPPKVRRLGRSATYLAPRQPIRTTAVECRIRGGEYTEPDQANLGTALRVWLPQAQSGDPEAQYYVGQMFEKGLGVPPDYASAASWYRKAAEQGYGAAQVAFGSMLEAGRGVEKNTEEALRWYRRAAGLADDLVVLQGSEYEELSGAKEELGTKQQELEKTRGEVKKLKKQVEELKKAPVEESGPKRGEINFGHYHALVIGNSDYAALADLPTSRQDAELVADQLRSRYGFEVDVILNATRLDIMRSLNKLREELTPDDNLLIYYSGHAKKAANGTTAYWQPVDAEAANPSNWIPSGVITDHLDLIPARHVMVVADAMFSGLRTRSGVAQLPRGMTEDERYYNLRLLQDKRARLVLASGVSQPRPDPKADHSVFTEAFVDTLEQNDSVLESSRLYRRMNQQLTQEGGGSHGLEFGPMQFARADVSEFFFVRRSK